MEKSDFDSKSHAFLRWFQSLPGATFHEGIEIQDLRSKDAGRGIVATVDIEPETVLFTIPRKSVICAATSELGRKVPDLFNLDKLPDENEDHVLHEDDPAARHQDSWSSLILVMMYEFIKGEASAWKPYLDVLSSDYSYTPMFWSTDDLKELQASPMLAKIGREDAATMIRTKIIPVVQEHRDLFFTKSDQQLTDDELSLLAFRMGSTIMAYAFELEEDDDENENSDGWVEDREGKALMGMVPMADMLNADAEFNAHVNHGDETLTVTALRPIAKGEEILNYYGPLPNSELLRRYGYTSAKHDRYNVVDLPWELITSSLRHDLALHDGAWEKVNHHLVQEEIEDGFIIERDVDGPDWTGGLPDTTAIADIPGDLVEQLKALLKVVKRVFPGSIEEKPMRDVIMFNAILHAITAREKQYLTTLEEDRALLEHVAAGGFKDARRMAIDVRLGEKLLLREARITLQDKLNRITQVDDIDGPAAKRRKTRE